MLWFHWYVWMSRIWFNIFIECDATICMLHCRRFFICNEMKRVQHKIIHFVRAKRKKIYAQQVWKRHERKNKREKDMPKENKNDKTTLSMYIQWKRTKPTVTTTTKKKRFSFKRNNDTFYKVKPNGIKCLNTIYGIVWTLNMDEYEQQKNANK